MMDEMLDVTSEEQFDKEVLQAELPVVVTFHAEWCGDCKKMYPHLSAMADEYGQRMKFVRVEDSHRDIEARYQVHMIPDVLLFYGGKLIHRWVNITDENAYPPTFERFLAKNPGPATSPRGDACEIKTKPT